MTNQTTTLLYTLHGFAVFLLVLWSAIWILHIIALFWSHWKLHRKLPILDPEVPLPGVSVIKPLVGVDPNLHSNLESFFTMGYPKYELLFCVQDKLDPAIQLVESIMEKYPNVDAKLFVGGESVGINPKINNMQPAYAAARSDYELVLVSDSGIRMKEDTLLDMVSNMTELVGLVHQMPYVCDRSGFPAILEKVYFGTYHARMYLGADCLGVNCPTGMSALMRKKLLDEAGGIKEFGCYLAEDYFFAKSITNRGWRISIASQPAWQNSGFCDISSFQRRISRWAKLRLAMVPLVMAGEPFTECMLLGILASISTRIVFHWDPIVVFLIHLLIWCILDWFLLKSVQNGSLPFTKFEYVLAWLLRELMTPFIFIHALSFPNIRWREGYYRLEWGGRVEKLN